MDTIIGFSLAALGAICASFVGVIAERAYTGQTWKRGRSRCNSCREDLSARDLVPVLSWVLSCGRCRRCKVRVPVLYVVLELLMGGLFYGAYLTLGLGLPLVAFLISLLLLLFIVLYDLRHTIVPLAAAFWLIAFGALFGFLSAPTIAAFGVSVLVSICVAAFFFLLFLLSRGRAMGLGDTPVAFGLSLLVGSQAVSGVLFSFWIGGLIGICILVLRREGPRMGIEVPFVPFLAAGYLLAFFTQWNPLPLL